MKIARKVICLVVCLLLVSNSLVAITTYVENHIKIWVSERIEIEIVDGHLHLILPDTVPGGLPADATANTTYGVYANSDRYKIVAIMEFFPADPNIEVTMNADPTTGAVSVGDITWTSASVEGDPGMQDCITGIVPVTEIGIPLGFTLHCTGIPAPHSDDYMRITLRGILE